MAFAQIHNLIERPRTWLALCCVLAARVKGRAADGTNARVLAQPTASTRRVECLAPKIEEGENEKGGQRFALHKVLHLMCGQPKYRWAPPKILMSAGNAATHTAHTHGPGEIQRWRLSCCRRRLLYFVV